MNLPQFTYLQANFLQHLTEKKLLPCLFRLSLYNRAVFRAQIASVILQNQKTLTIFGSLRQYSKRWSTDCPNMHSQLLSSFIHTLVASGRAFLSGKEMQSFEV